MTYCDLEHELLTAIVGVEGVEDGGQLFGVELDCGGKVKLLAWRCFSAALSPGERCSGVHTIDDGTNDLMDLAFSHGIGRGEALGDGRHGDLGLEGSLDGGPAER
jgi:hypothetical protein